MGRISPNYFVQDGVIPRTELPEVLRAHRRARRGVRADRRQRLPRRRRQPAPARLLRRRASEGEAERAEELAGLIIDACLDAGGSITGEHGVGVDKKQHMPKMFAEPDLDAFQRLRCAFDPAGLANPGKVMPTPRLCGEVPGPVPAAPARGGRAGGAVLSGLRDRDQRAPARRGRRALLRRCATTATRPPGRRRARSRWGGPVRRPRCELATGGAGPDPRAQRGRLHRGARGRRAARGRRRRAFAEARPDAGARPAARRGRRRDDRRDRRDRATRARCATATAASRDLVVGMTVVLADGTVAKSGGKVIKNVAGYDLAKLFAGSFGTLGLIARVAVRLHPLPDTRRDRGRVETDDPEASRPRPPPRSPRTRSRPTALDVELGRAARAPCSSRFGGARPRANRPRRVGASTRRARRRARRGRRRRAVGRASAALQRPPSGVVLKVSGRPPTCAPSSARPSAAAARSSSRAALGLSWLVDCPTTTPPSPRSRERAAARAGAVHGARRPAERAGRRLGRRRPGRARVMARLKARFDPRRTFRPGAFVGGI